MWLLSSLVRSVRRRFNHTVFIQTFSGDQYWFFVNTLEEATRLLDTYKTRRLVIVIQITLPGGIKGQTFFKMRSPFRLPGDIEQHEQQEQDPA